MDIDAFMAKVLGVFPNATMMEDNDGQLVIYTDLYLKDGRVVPVEELGEGE